MKVQAQEILDFWFGRTDELDYGIPKDFWFRSTPEFDTLVRNQFFLEYEKAALGQLDDWKSTPESSLALILLLDQFPRNMFRGTPQAFATDWEALTIAHQVIAQGFDQKLLPVQRWFIYCPFEHSENLDHQHKAVDLFMSLSNHPDSAEAIEYAMRHRDIISRFGRFPHRNAILRRPSTADEKEFLKQPESGF